MRHALAALLLIVSAGPALAALRVGEAAPGLAVQGVLAGEPVRVDLAALLRKGPVVLYFYPSAFTEGAGARHFVQLMDRFEAAGATVVGLSRDAPDALIGFSRQEAAGRFAVVSASEALVDAYDVNDGASFNTRTTYVVDPSGKIAFVHDADDPAGHAPGALAVVEAMKR